MGYTLSYPDIAFVFSPCFLTVTGENDSIDVVTLQLASDTSISETRYTSNDVCRFDLRPFLLGSISADYANGVDYDKDIQPGSLKSVQLNIFLDGQNVGDVNNKSISIYACYASVGLMDNLSNNRRLPYNPNYPFSLDVFSDGPFIDVDGEYNYAFATGMSVTERIWDEGITFYDLDHEVQNKQELYISATIKVQIVKSDPPTYIRIRTAGFNILNIPAKDGVYNINERLIRLNIEEYNHLWVLTDGDVTVTVSNLMLSDRPSPWLPNPIDLLRKSNLLERRTASLLGLGFEKLLPNPITYWIDECFTGQPATNGSITHISDQYITLYPDNRNDGIYLRWLDKFGRMCYRLFNKASEGIQVLHENTFYSGVEQANNYNSIIGHPADREHSTSTVQRTIQIGEQACDKYAIQELIGLVSSQFVYMYNKGTKRWIRVNVVPGSYTIKGRSLQEFGLTIRLPKETPQHL